MRRVPVRPLLGVHPGLILAVLDLVGLAIAPYLSVVELGGGVPACGPIKGCEEVALSEYSRIGGVPVAVYGVGLSLILFSLAIAWWRTNLELPLLAPRPPPPHGPGRRESRAPPSGLRRAPTARGRGCASSVGRHLRPGTGRARR